MPSEQKFAQLPALTEPRSARRRLLVRSGMAGLVTAIAVGALALESQGQEVPADKRALFFAGKPSRVQVSPDGREVLVEFPGALPDGEAERVSKSLGKLLEGYSEGFGAVRFRLTGPVQAEMSGTRTVEITPRPEERGTAEDDRRLALLQAKQQAQDGDLAGAEQQLRRMAAERPKDIEPVLALAETEVAAAHWQHALGLYDGVLRLIPQATDIVRERDQLAFRNGPAIRTTAGATFGPNGERSQTATVGAEVPLGESWRAGASLQTTHDSIRGLRRSGSAVAADYDGIKLLGSVSLAHDWGSPRNTTRVDLFAAPRTLGLSLKQELKTRYGQTSIGAIYHQPYWGTVMAFAADARRDQAGIAQTVPLPDDWEVSLGAGLVRYGLPDHDSVASGATALAGVNRGLPESWMPLAGMQARIGYRMEAEYLSRTETGPTAAGLMPLLDVRRREFHSLYTEASMPAGPGTATTVLGYALDRFGGGGPQALLRFTSGQDDDRLVYSAEAGLEPSLDIKPRTLFHIGGNLVWRFGG